MRVFLLCGENMAKLGNYGVFYPYKYFNPGQRFFFFNSLINKSSGRGRTGSNLAEEVTEYLYGENLNNLTTVKNNEGYTLMEQSMNFLKQIIEREKKQERLYFETHIKNNKQLPSNIRKKLQSCFSDEENGSFSIDYLNFIQLINLFYSDIDNYTYILKSETERLHEVNELIQEFKSLSLKKQKEYKRKELKNKNNSTDDERFFIGFRNFLTDKLKKDSNGIYIDYDSAEKAKRILDTKALTNRIQDQLKRTFLMIWNSPEMKERIKTILLNETSQEKELSQTILISLLSEYLLVARESVIKILEETEKNLEEGQSLNKEQAKALAKQFIDSLDLKESNGDIPLEKDLQIMIKRAKQYLDSQTVDDKILKRFFSNINIEEVKGHMAGEEVGRQRGSITGLTEDLIAILEPALQAEAKTKDIKLINTNNSKERRAALIQNLIRLAESDGIKIKTKKKINYTKLEAYIKNKIEKHNLVQVQVKKNDNILSELDAGLGLIRGLAANNNFIEKTTANILMDGYQKSDVAFFELGEYHFTPNIPDSLWEDIANSIVKDYNSSNQISKIEISSSKNKYDEATSRKYSSKKNRNNQPFSAQEFFIEGETQRRIVTLEKTRETIQNQLKEQGASTKEIQKVLQTLKNSFQISATVKSYDKLDNEKGFHGGSLGGTIESQLNNIYDMFELGGIDLPDMQWMMTAIYNAGPGMLGNKLNNTLEDIFSTLAVTMLFDDAGQQASYIKSQAYDNFNVASVNFLHIYQLNGIYFPASFILQLTYDGLLNAETMLLDIPNSNGSRANIINPVHQGHMVGEDRGGGYKVVTSPQDWYDTFEKNRKKVTISLTFLAGFLDILNKLQDAMTNPFAK